MGPGGTSVLLVAPDTHHLSPSTWELALASHVRIFDTTLRDGEQSPGFSLTSEQKLEFARQLERLNVDVIEAGYPNSSPEDFEAVQLIGREIQGPAICALSRAVAADSRSGSASSTRGAASIRLILTSRSGSMRSRP